MHSDADQRVIELDGDRPHNHGSSGIVANPMPLTSLLGFREEPLGSVTLNVVPRIRTLWHATAAQHGESRLTLAANAAHVSQVNAPGSSWACGWRNLQTLLSALMEEPVYRATICEGTGVLPDICTLQRQLERAWRLGFDAIGARQFGHRIAGTSKFIGATDVCALLRSWRIPAEVVAFHAHDSALIPVAAAYLVDRQVAAGACDPARRADRVEAMVDRIALHRRAALAALERAGTLPSGVLDDAVASLLKRSQALHDAGTGREAYVYDADTAVRLGVPSSVGRATPAGTHASNIHAAINQYHRARHVGLVRWLMQHFDAHDGTAADANSNTMPMATKAERATRGQQASPPFPIYIQHDGHSRTLIGIECRPLLSPATSRGNAVTHRGRKRNASTPPALGYSKQGTVQVPLSQYFGSRSTDHKAITINTSASPTWCATHGSEPTTRSTTVACDNHCDLASAPSACSAVTPALERTVAAAGAIVIDDDVDDDGDKIHAVVLHSDEEVPSDALCNNRDDSFKEIMLLILDPMTRAATMQKALESGRYAHLFEAFRASPLSITH